MIVSLMGVAHITLPSVQLLRACYTMKVSPFVVGVRHSSNLRTWTICTFLALITSIPFVNYKMTVTKPFQLNIDCNIVKFLIYAHYCRRPQTKSAHRKASYVSSRQSCQPDWINIYYIIHSSCACPPFISCTFV